MYSTRLRAAKFGSLLTAFLLVASCGIVIVTGPSTVADGEYVTYTLSVQGNESDSYYYVTADVPVGWRLDAAQYRVMIDGEPVTEIPYVIGSSPCDHVALPTGFKRVRLVEPSPPAGGPDSADVRLTFEVRFQPAGEYKIAFRFGSTGFGRSCTAPAVRTIHREETLLDLDEVHREGVADVSGLRGASDLATSPDGEMLLVAGSENGTLGVFHLDRATGRFEFIEKVTIQDSGQAQAAGLPPRVRFSPTGDLVYLTEPAKDRVLAFERGGRSIQFAGSFHSSSIPELEGVRDFLVTRGHAYALSRVPGLLSWSEIAVFDLDPSGTELFHVETFRLPRSAGNPVHMTLGAGDRGLFALARGTDGGLVLSAFERDPETGTIAFDSYDRVGGYDLPADLLAIPGTDAVYAASEEEIVLWSWRPDGTGLVLENPELLAGTPFGPHKLNGIALDPEGNFLAAVGDNYAALYRRNSSSNLLSLIDVEFHGDPPNEGLLGSTSAALTRGEPKALYVVSPEEDALSVWTTQMKLFTDGFESGDAEGWSAVVE